MKSNTFIVFSALLLVITYQLVLRIKPDEQGEMARCIPSTALFYLEQHNGLGTLKRVVSSPLGESISSIDFLGVAKEVEADEKTIAAINNFLTNAKSILDNPLSTELYGKRFAVAVLPPVTTSSGFQDADDFLRENTVLVAEPQQSAKVLELLAITLGGSIGNVAITSIQYGRHKILRIFLKAQTFSLVTLEGFVLLSQNERQLRRCIDTFDGEQPAFSGNSDFLALTSSFPAAESILVFPLAHAWEYLPDILINYNLRGMPWLKSKSPLMKGIKGFSGAAKRDDSTVMGKIFVSYEHDGRDDSAQEQPAKPSHLSLTTTNPMFYLWSNSFDLKRLLNYVEDNISRLGTSVENDSEGQAMFGKEITVIAEPAAENVLVPIPLALMFIPVGDQDALKATLEELLDTNSIPIKTDEYGAVSYASWSQSPQDGLTLLYGFWGDLFFLGNSTTLLHKVIDTNSRNFSLFDNDMVKKIGHGLAKASNTVFYSNNEQLFDIIKTALNLLGTVMAIEDREFAVKARVVINKIFYPLLDGAKMYNSSFAGCSLTPEKLVVDVIINVADHP